MTLSLLPFTHPKKIHISVPGSKSITNRAFLCAALAEGKSTLKTPLHSIDTERMQVSLDQLGIQVQQQENGDITIGGRGGVFDGGEKTLFLENAGTAVRFLTAAMALRKGKTILDGNERMRERPLKHLIRSLQQAGVPIDALHENGCPPVEIHGGTLSGGAWTIDGSASSQYVSALLLIAPYAASPVTITLSGELVSKPYLTITLEVMKQFGVDVETVPDFSSFRVLPQKYKATEFSVEGDASSASYFYGIAMATQSETTVQNITTHSSQGDIQLLKFFEQMGGILQTNTDGTFTLQGPSELKSLGEIDCNHIPDAAMTLAVVATLASGTTIIRGVENMRIKETDRITALVTELKKMGAKVSELPDGLSIHGDPSLLHGAAIDTYDDHRMAMCFSVLSTKIPGLEIRDPECTQKTYPNFWEDLSLL